MEVGLLLLLDAEAALINVGTKLGAAFVVIVVVIVVVIAVVVISMTVVVGAIAFVVIVVVVVVVIDVMELFELDADAFISGNVGGPLGLELFFFLVFFGVRVGCMTMVVPGGAVKEDAVDADANDDTADVVAPPIREGVDDAAPAAEDVGIVAAVMRPVGAVINVEPEADAEAAAAADAGIMPIAPPVALLLTTTAVPVGVTPTPEVPPPPETGVMELGIPSVTGVAPLAKTILRAPLGDCWTIVGTPPEAAKVGGKPDAKMICCGCCCCGCWDCCCCCCSVGG